MEPVPIQPFTIWRGVTELSVGNAALLILGKDPEKWAQNSHAVEGFETLSTQLCLDIHRKRLAATVVYRRRETDDTPANIDIWNSTVLFADVRAWLESRNALFPPLFFPNNPEISGEPDRPAYLDKKNPHYSFKLHAANSAHSAVTSDPRLLRGTTPKAACKKWLTQRAATFGLVAKNGRPNLSAIEDVAKVANWETRGGAPKTPE